MDSTGNNSVDDLLKPAPFKHSESDIFVACSVDRNRTNGVLFYYKKMRKSNLKKRSSIIEFIENALDLTRREQLILAFKAGIDQSDH